VVPLSVKLQDQEVVPEAVGVRVTDLCDHVSEIESVAEKDVHDHVEERVSVSVGEPEPVSDAEPDTLTEGVPVTESEEETV
jgi:hypothetical protein